MIKIKNKKILISIITILLLSGAALAYFYMNKDSSNQTSSTTDSSGGGINFNPSTEVEKQDAEDRKATLSDEGENNDDLNSKKKVIPVITYSGEYFNNIEVSARVPDNLEEKGTCTLTMTKDGKSISESKQASPNVSEMSCGVIKIAKSKLAKGDWSARVNYSSDKAEGASERFNIEVK